MEENEYRQAYDNLNPNPCVFEKAILNNRGDCAQCQRVNLAEREGVACLSPRGTLLCADLLKQLRQKAKFALKLSQLRGPLPHAKELKVQGGGLLGLQAVLSPDLRDVKQVGNIAALVTQALATFDEFEKRPYQEIVKFVSRYQVRAKKYNE
jgi:hypothetical protein